MQDWCQPVRFNLNSVQSEKKNDKGGDDICSSFKIPVDKFWNIVFLFNDLLAGLGFNHRLGSVEFGIGMGELMLFGLFHDDSIPQLGGS